MVEVFKTNVNDPYHANMLIEQIKKMFTGYTVNFDLEDCDKILRVKSAGRVIESLRLINLFKDSGFHAEILTDDPLTFRDLPSTRPLLSKNLIGPV